MAHAQQRSDNECRSQWPDITEYDLVRLAQSGNKSAFEELARRNSEICVRVATCILSSREDALDEVQNALWLAYSRIALFTYQAKFSTWLVRIVINSCLMRLRGMQRSPILTKQRTTEDGGCPSHEGVTSDTPESDLGRKQVRRALRRELGSIPPLLRIPIELHYLHEMPTKKVAKELGLTVSAAKSRLHRGHLYLRDRMLKHVTRLGAASLTAN
jgi:RNA polymerase sigma-70 factor, ECF subfamily